MIDPVFFPSQRQQKFLSIGLVPASLLSIIGSSLIITNIRNEKRKSPYRNIMLWLSSCDIINSFGWILQPLLSPSEGPEAWAFALGNDVSCNFMGGMAQFGFSAHWYTGLLSFYFLLTARYGIQEKKIGKALPYVHGVIFVWSISTAIAGVALKVYNPMGLSPGCWVAGEDCTEDCIHTAVAWVFGGIPSLMMLLSIVINNLLLYCHVRRTVAEGQKRAMEVEENLTKYGGGGARRKSDRWAALSEVDHDYSHDFSMCTTTAENKPESNQEETEPTARSLEFATHEMPTRSNNKSTTSNLRLNMSRQKSVLLSSEKQWKLVQEVGTQSFLYVCAYILCYTWSLFVNALDSQQYEYEPGAGKVFLPLLILQSLFLPMQGFFNATIFFRPKYLKNCKDFPNESRFWRIRRAVLGKKVHPSPPKMAPQQKSAHHLNQSQSPRLPPSTLRFNCSGQRAMSSLGREVSSGNDCDRIDEEEKESNQVTA
eukprot:scaffold1429_cov110-Cylindrotheca_fusiformis.AAC.4